MKIKHFLGLCGTGVLTLWGGCVMALADGPPVPAGPEWRPLPQGEWSEDAYPDFSEANLEVWVGQDIGEAEVRDAEEGSEYKIKVRQFLYDTSVSRIWVDLDRDWMWDIRGEVRDGNTLVIRYSPGDNEKYEPAVEWTGSGWTPAVMELKQKRETAAGDGMSPAVFAAVSFQGQKLPEARLDVEPDRPWKLDVYPGDDGTTGRAELDTDRDGETDQIWRFTDPVIAEIRPRGAKEAVTYIWDGERLIPQLAPIPD
ncbi:MAG: hypothetical protein GY913_02240 [Proteobacteria bacterium]|nr:hypothetical protein [Pseudomonadota bacterium]